MDVGVLLLRILLAALLAGHAAQKLFGWFSGMGPARTGAIFEQWGFRPGRQMVLTAAVCELLGAGSIALGLLTPGGCALVIGTMIVAASPNARNGLWAHLGGCEVPVTYAGIAVALAFTGPGRYSLDNLVGLDGLSAIGWSIAAVVVGVLAAIPVLARRQAALRADAPAPAPADPAALPAAEPAASPAADPAAQPAAGAGEDNPLAPLVRPAPERERSGSPSA